MKSGFKHKRKKSLIYIFILMFFLTSVCSVKADTVSDTRDDQSSSSNESSATIDDESTTDADNASISEEDESSTSENKNTSQEDENTSSEKESGGDTEKNKEKSKSTDSDSSTEKEYTTANHAITPVEGKVLKAGETKKVVRKKKSRKKYRLMRQAAVDERDNAERIQQYYYKIKALLDSKYRGVSFVRADIMSYRIVDDEMYGYAKQMSDAGIMRCMTNYAFNTVNVDMLDDDVKNILGLHKYEIVDLGRVLSEKIAMYEEIIEEQEQNIIFADEAIVQDEIIKKVTTSHSYAITFDPNDLNVLSGINEAQMKKMLLGTKLTDIAGAFVKAEKKYGVNAIGVAAIAALESGWGTSNRAINDHNYTGFGVYSDSAVGKNADTGEANILETAQWLSTHYLKPGQVYYNGPGLVGINKKYSVSYTWASKVEHCAKVMFERYG